MRFAFLLSIPFYYNTSNNNLFAANICLCLITVKIVFMALWGTAGFSIVLASLFTRWWTGTTYSKSWIQRGGGPCAGRTMGRHRTDHFRANHGKQRLPKPVLVDFKLGALGACQHWSSAAMPLQKPLSHAGHSGHAITAVMEHSNIFLLQVGYLKTSACCNSCN